MSARDVIAAEFGRMHQSVCYPTASDGEKEWAGDSILAALTAAGYRIVPPGGLDAETVTRGIEAISKLSWRRYSDGSSGGVVEYPPARDECINALRSLIEEPDAIAQRNGGKT